MATITKANISSLFETNRWLGISNVRHMQSIEFFHNGQKQKAPPQSGNFTFSFSVTYF